MVMGPERRARARRVWELKQEGRSNVDIAETLGLGADTVCEDLKEWRLEGQMEGGENPAEFHRYLSYSRMEQMIRKLHDKGVTDNDDIRLLLQVVGEERKLLGVDMPVKVDLNVNKVQVEINGVDMEDV